MSDIAVEDHTPKRPHARHEYCLTTWNGIQVTAEAIAPPLDDRLGFGNFEIIGQIKGVRDGYIKFDMTPELIDEAAAVLARLRALAASDSQVSG